MKVSAFAVDIDRTITEDVEKIRLSAAFVSRYMEVKMRAFYVTHRAIAKGLVEGIEHAAERFIKISLG